MRRAWIFALLVAERRAEAQPAPPQGPPAAPVAGEFWREVLEPHGDAVTEIVGQARGMLAKASESAENGDGADGSQLRYTDHAYRMLRHARTLSPENAEVLGLFGATADELGKTRQALEALEACVTLHGPEGAGAEVTGRLGMIYLRLGRLDDAVRWLRHAQGPIAAANHASAAVHLATALAARGEMASAIDVLKNALPPQANYFTDPTTLVSLALAVHYDRDEQPGAAFEVLDRMQAALQQELGPFVQRAIAQLRFAPAEDESYYQALLYEAIGAYTEARAEWALYAQLSDGPWRRRALDHVHAIDAQRRAGRALVTRPGTPSARAIQAPPVP